MVAILIGESVEPANKVQQIHHPTHTAHTNQRSFTSLFPMHIIFPCLDANLCQGEKEYTKPKSLLTFVPRGPSVTAGLFVESFLQGGGKDITASILPQAEYFAERSHNCSARMNFIGKSESPANVACQQQPPNGA